MLRKWSVYRYFTKAGDNATAGTVLALTGWIRNAGTSPLIFQYGVTAIIDLSVTADNNTVLLVTKMMLE